GRLAVNLVDAPWAGIPTNIIWRKRRFRCLESKCPVVTFTEENRGIAASRALLTARAARWAVGQMRRENASVRGLARQMGTAWQTVWSAVEPILEAAADDESRFAGVEALGVDEHVWHHGDQRVRGSRYFTGMTDLTRHTDPKTGKKQVRARLLDLVGGRSGPVLGDWLKERGEQWRADVKVAAIESLSDCLCKRWIVNFD
ncbi:MAG: ISL3 family transposase, partial [Promicromonosporaceae bacterium]|nr:ISL3 family transposase [Promicromonosporaceae bacterium]